MQHRPTRRARLVRLAVAGAAVALVPSAAAAIGSLDQPPSEVTGVDEGMTFPHDHDHGDDRFSAAYDTTAPLRPITFPVLGGARLVDDFGACRSGCTRRHEGTDLMGPKMRPLVAVADGVVSSITIPEASWGYAVTIRDAEGWTYHYLHVNNDTPGTDDGRGGVDNAFPPNVRRGSTVRKGQLLAYLGDSGNAEGTAPHLHFEIRRPDGTPIDPHRTLLAAPVPQVLGMSAAPGDIAPYGAFAGGAHVATCRASSTKTVLATGAGRGGGPHVKVLEQTGTELASFISAKGLGTGGVDVACGDLNGDGVDELVTGAGPSAEPLVSVHRLDGTLLRSFHAYAPAFKGGVSVAVGDVDGDGRAEIATGPGPGGGPHVITWRPDGTLRSGGFPYAQAFTGGVSVALADLDGDRRAELVTGAGPGGGPHVGVLRGTDLITVAGFFAYGSTFTGGVEVAAGDLDGDGKAEVVSGAMSGGGPHVRAFGVGLAPRGGGVMAFDSWFTGGVHVAVGARKVWAGTGVGNAALVRPITTL